MTETGGQDKQRSLKLTSAFLIIFLITAGLSPAQEAHEKFKANLAKAGADIENKNFGKAIISLETNLHYNALTLDDSLRCLSLLKKAFIQIGNISKAFETQHLLERRWERKSDTAHIDFGEKESTLYNRLGLRTEAIKQRRKEFDALRNKSDTEAIINFYNDMGVFFNGKKTTDSAEVYFMKAAALLEKIRPSKERESHYEFYRGLVAGNLGMSYYLKGDAHRAIPLLKKDVYYSMKAGQFESAFNSYVVLVNCHLLQQDAKNAGAFLDTARVLLNDKLQSESFQLKFLMVEARYYDFIKNYRLANLSYRHYYNLNDSIFTLEKEKELINQGMAFTIEKHELEFEEKENAFRRLKEDDSRQKTYKIFLLAGLSVLLTIIILLIINNRRSKKREKQLSSKNNQIQVQNTQIEQSLKEKEALIKEIHHRVKNNLQIINSMLNLQIGKIQDEKTESIFFEAKQRINAIALTHQMLYQKTTLSNINLAEYVETLVRQIEATMSSTSVVMRTEIVRTQERLTIDGAVPLGLVINELLTNAYKHAFPRGKKGTISVSLIENSDSFTICVSDDGVGLPKGFNHTESQTLGMELIFILVEQLESKLIIEEKGGSTFKFDIKKHK